MFVNNQRVLQEVHVVIIIDQITCGKQRPKSYQTADQENGKYDRSLANRISI